MTLSRDVVAALILVLAVAPGQALRGLQGDPPICKPGEISMRGDCADRDELDFAKTEIVSKYGIMFSTDVFPLNPWSDTKKLSKMNFTDLGVTEWAAAEISRKIDAYELLEQKKTDVAVAYELLERSRQQGTTSIHHSMYIDAINTATASSSIPSVYVISTAIPAFIKSVFPKIKGRFVLVTGDSTLRVPSQVFQTDEKMQRFINHPKVVHWFAQNGDLDHPKFTRIPNGMDYHSLAAKGNEKWGARKSPTQQDNLLRKVRQSAPEFSNRTSKVLVGFSTDTSAARSHVLNHFKNSHIYQDTSPGDREHYWKDIALTKYVASPSGAGWDCHRTWEALALGSIPIVESTGIDKLFLDNGLPVSIITDWAEVENLEVSQLAKKFGERSKVVPPAITLKYWVDQIKSKSCPAHPAYRYVAQGTGVCRDASGKYPSWALAGRTAAGAECACSAEPLCSGYSLNANGNYQYFCQSSSPEGSCTVEGNGGSAVTLGGGQESSEHCTIKKAT